MQASVQSSLASQVSPLSPTDASSRRQRPASLVVSSPSSMSFGESREALNERSASVDDGRRLMVGNSPVQPQLNSFILQNSRLETTPEERLSQENEPHAKDGPQNTAAVPPSQAAEAHSRSVKHGVPPKIATPAHHFGSSRIERGFSDESTISTMSEMQEDAATPPIAAFARNESQTSSGSPKEDNKDTKSMNSKSPAAALSYLGSKLKEWFKKSRNWGKFGMLPLHPEGKFRRVWDVILLLAILYSSFAVPFQLAFNPPTNNSIRGLDIFIEVFFLLDIALNFVTAIDREGVIVRDPRTIQITYIKSWMVLDLVASFPSEMAFGPADSSSSSDGSETVRGLRLLRTLRLLRLTRMLRIFRMSRHLRSLKYTFPELNVALEVSRLMFMMMFLAHIFACAFYATTLQKPECSWLAEYFFDINCDLDESQNVFDYAILEDTGNLYSAAIYWSFTTLTTVGYGDIIAVNKLERTIATFSMVAGSAMFAFIVGRLASVASQVNYKDMVIQSKSEKMEQYMKERDLPRLLRVKVRRYCDESWAKTVFNETEQLDELSAKLRREVAIVINKKIISKVPLFKKLDDNILEDISASMKPVSAFPGDVIIREGEVGQEMYIIVRGEAEVIAPNGITVWRVLRSGTFFGEIGLVCTSKRTATVQAKTLCDMFVLVKSDLVRLLKQHPSAEKLVNKYAKRAVRQYLQQGNFQSSSLTAKEALKLARQARTTHDSKSEANGVNKTQPVKSDPAQHNADTISTEPDPNGVEMIKLRTRRGRLNTGSSTGSDSPSFARSTKADVQPEIDMAALETPGGTHSANIWVRSMSGEGKGRHSFNRVGVRNWRGLVTPQGSTSDLSKEVQGAAQSSQDVKNDRAADVATQSDDEEHREHAIQRYQRRESLTERIHRSMSDDGILQTGQAEESGNREQNPAPVNRTGSDSGMDSLTSELVGHAGAIALATSSAPYPLNPEDMWDIPVGFDPEEMDAQQRMKSTPSFWEKKSVNDRSLFRGMGVEELRKKLDEEQAEFGTDHDMVNYHNVDVHVSSSEDEEPGPSTLRRQGTEKAFV